MKRAHIEAAWARNPGLTLEQVRRLTGAPKAVVRFVYRKLVDAGKLARQGRPRDVLSGHV